MAREPKLSGLLKPGRSRRRRKRLHPAFAVLIGLVALGGLGVLYYWVFADLAIDPEEWVQRERTFRQTLREVVAKSAPDEDVGAPELPPWPQAQSDAQLAMVACAHAQHARGALYTSRYHPMRYPWGDIPDQLVTSADVLIRCLRGLNLDLQQMVHLDRVAHRRRYPLWLWASKRPDKSIDHRRMPNLFTFANTFFPEQPILVDSPERLAAFQPGDVIFWGKGQFPTQAGIVSDRRGPDGAPLVITIAPRDKRLSDHHPVNRWKLMARFRIDPGVILESFLAANPTARLAPKP